MSYDKKNSFWEDRDRLIFSKAHGAYGLYAILADLGFMPKEEWNNYYIEGKSNLAGCLEQNLKYGIEAGCGSLGHGLPIAVGIAYGSKLQKKSFYTFCLVGDGELEEGTTWEALQFAVKHKIKNLIIIVDNNGLSAMDFLTNIMDEDEKDLIKRFEGFKLSPVICSGHDSVKLADFIQAAKSSNEEKPKIIIAKTTKGYGLRCMENAPEFHFRIPTEEDLKMGKTYNDDAKF